MNETIKRLKEIVSKKMGFKEIAMCAGAIPDLLTYIEELERTQAVCSGPCHGPHAESIMALQKAKDAEVRQYYKNLEEKVEELERKVAAGEKLINEIQDWCQRPKAEVIYDGEPYVEKLIEAYRNAK